MLMFASCLFSYKLFLPSTLSPPSHARAHALRCRRDFTGAWDLEAVHGAGGYSLHHRRRPVRLPQALPQLRRNHEAALHVQA